MPFPSFSSLFKKQIPLPTAPSDLSSLVLPWMGGHRPRISSTRTRALHNAIAYRCLTMIAQGAASIDWILLEGDREVEAHPFLDLLASPNPLEDGTTFFERVYGHLYLYGNAYLHVTHLEGTPRELYTLRPDRVRLLLNAKGWPEAYEYTVEGRVKTFSQHGPLPSVLALKLLDPTQELEGTSPLEAASWALDVHGAATQWSYHLLQNAAKPSGALVYRGGEGVLNAEQFTRLKEQFEHSHQGTANAGRPLILEGGLDWVSIAHSPREMEHLEIRHAAAREIALALGVPPMLLGIPGDNTFANYAEANRTFWRQTLIPLAKKTASSLSRWLTLAYGAPLKLTCDLDGIEALSAERQALWDRVNAATFLTDSEKRQALGYGAR